MKNKLQLKLGEKEVVLKFNMGTLRRIKELSGRDPFSLMKELNDDDAVGMHQFACYVIDAGIRTNYNTDDSGITQDQLDELSITDVTMIVSAFINAYTPDQEADKKIEDTQSVDAG